MRLLEQQKQIFKLKNATVLEPDEEGGISRKYRYSASHTWALFQAIVKSMPQSKGQVIVVGVQSQVMSNSGILIRSDYDLREAFLQHRVGNTQTDLFTHLQNRLQQRVYKEYWVIPISTETPPARA